MGLFDCLSSERRCGLRVRGRGRGKCRYRISSIKYQVSRRRVEEEKISTYFRDHQDQDQQTLAEIVENENENGTLHQ